MRAPWSHFWLVLSLGVVVGSPPCRSGESVSWILVDSVLNMEVVNDPVRKEPKKQMCQQEENDEEKWHENESEQKCTKEINKGKCQEKRNREIYKNVN